MRQNEKVSTSLAAGVVLTAALGVFALISPLRNLSYELVFAARGEIPVEDVVIVYADEDSLDALGSADRSSLDRLDRRVHAQLIHKLSERGVPLIAFDVLFEKAAPQPEEDEAFVAAAKVHGNVLIGVRLEQEQDSTQTTTTKKLPFPNLREVVGYGLVEASWSGRSCRILMPQLEGIDSLAWKAAQKRRAAPLMDSNKIRWMNYYGPPGYISYISLLDVLSNRIPANITITNTTAVFVGANTTAGGFHGRGMDIFDTPYTLWTRKQSTGTEVCATAYLNLLRGDWLEELSWPFELGMILLFGGLAAVVIGSFRPLPGLGVGALLGIGLAVPAYFLAWKGHFWFPWVGMIGIQLPFAWAWSLLLHSGRLSDEMEALQKRLRQRSKRRKSDEPQKKPEGRKIAPVSEPEIPHTVLVSIPDHELLNVVGEGGFGKVWLARSLLLPDIFRAVKMVQRGPGEEQGKFEREFKGIQRFTAISRDHPGLVQILHVGQPGDGSCFYYIMEAADDQDSGKTIDPKKYSPRTLHVELLRHKSLSVPECIKLGAALASALQFLHEKDLIHRDIKPSNIIYVNAVPKLADISLLTDVPSTGHKLTYAGTLGYLAPEGPGIRGDVFALGQVLKDAHRGLQRGKADENDAVPLIQPSAPQEALLDGIIRKATDSDAAKRFQSAAELYRALLELQELINRFAILPTKLP